MGNQQITGGFPYQEFYGSLDETGLGTNHEYADSLYYGQPPSPSITTTHMAPLKPHPFASSTPIVAAYNSQHSKFTSKFTDTPGTAGGELAFLSRGPLSDVVNDHPVFEDIINADDDTKLMAAARPRRRSSIVRSKSIGIVSLSVSKDTGFNESTSTRSTICGELDEAEFCECEYCCDCKNFNCTLDSTDMNSIYSVSPSLETSHD